MERKRRTRFSRSFIVNFNEVSDYKNISLVDGFRFVMMRTVNRHVDTYTPASRLKICI